MRPMQSALWMDSHFFENKECFYMNIGKPSIKTYALLVSLLAVCGFYFYFSHLATVPVGGNYDQRLQESIARFNDPMTPNDIGELRKSFLSGPQQGHIDAPPNASLPWQRSEIERHKSGLVADSYDYIVVPVEEWLPDSDRVGRLVGASWVAQAIEQLSGNRVMPPELTLRLLGGSAIRFDDQAIFEIAERVGADVIYLLVKGRRQPGSEKKIVSVLTDSKGTIKRRSVNNLGVVRYDQPLEFRVRGVAQTIASELLVEPQFPEIEKQSFNLEGYRSLPRQLSDLLRTGKTPLEQSVDLQLIAMLTPHWLSYERRRLFERSLYALSLVGADSEGYNLLMARALFHLSRRPLALPYLEQASTPAELAMKEYLNGNYPEMRSAILNIENQIFKILATIELEQLVIAYDKPHVDGKQLSGESNWGPLIEASLKDNDSWFAPDAIEFFTQLEGLFPAFDILKEQITVEHVVSGENQLSKQTYDLMERLWTRASLPGAPACCSTYSAKIEQADLWRFYRNHNIANSLRELNLSINVLASYKQPLVLSKALEAWYLGQPTFTRLYAEALQGEARNKQGMEKAHLMEQADAMARDAITYSAAINPDSVLAERIVKEARQYMSASKRRKDRAAHSLNQYLDLPLSLQFVAPGELKASLAVTNSRFGVLQKAYEIGEMDDGQVDVELNNRFNGHPDKTVFYATRLASKGESREAISLLRGEVDLGSDVWLVYQTLSGLLIDVGDYSDAAKICQQYPLFINVPDEDLVTISNRAVKCVNRLFWLGHANEAAPMYGLAASLDTGADSELKAQQRLSMLASDYETALATAQKRGQRYNSRYGYRDYLIYLQMLGFHDVAESGFNNLAPRFDSPPVWTSMFIGQRMKAMTLSAIQSWTTDFLNMSTNNMLESQAKSYVLVQTMVDRTVGREGLDAVATFAPTYNRPFAIAPRPGFSNALGQSANKIVAINRPCRQPPETCVDKDINGNDLSADIYVGFMRAYILLKESKYKDALDAFFTYDKYSDFAVATNVVTGAFRKQNFALPYAAMAAVKSRPAEQLAKLLLVVEKEKGKDRFYSDLSRAVIFAGLSDNEKALSALIDAYHNRPFTGWRPIYSWYQLTETAEWIHQLTGDRSVIQLAVDWAKKHQVIQPHFAWAFAFEALYSTHQSGRIVAAAYANYFDPNSKWLDRVPEEIRQQGVLWWNQNNPYKPIKENLIRPKQGEKSNTITKTPATPYLNELVSTCPTFQRDLSVTDGSSPNSLRYFWAKSPWCQKPQALTTSLTFIDGSAAQDHK